MEKLFNILDYLAIFLFATLVILSLSESNWSALLGWSCALVWAIRCKILESKLK